MSNINTAVLSGNLTADPESKVVGDDFTIVNLRMAVNRSKKNKESGDYEDETSYFDVTVFGSFGELCDRKLRKGNALTVTGRLEQQRWETAEGDKRSKVVLIASDIDSQAFFQKAEDVPAKTEGESKPAAAPAAPANDDIPF